MADTSVETTSVDTTSCVILGVVNHSNPERDIDAIIAMCGFFSDLRADSAVGGFEFVAQALIVQPDGSSKCRRIYACKPRRKKTDPRGMNRSTRPTLRPTNRNLPLSRIRRQNQGGHRWS